MKIGIKRKFSILFLLIPFLFQCQEFPRPVDEYAFARAAVDAAKSSDAPRHSPGLWHQAEHAYHQARIYYRDHEWAKAKTEFLRAKMIAEKAENSARLIRQKTGDVL